MIFIDVLQERDQVSGWAIGKNAIGLSKSASTREGFKRGRERTRRALGTQWEIGSRNNVMYSQEQDRKAKDCHRAGCLSCGRRSSKALKADLKLNHNGGMRGQMTTL